MTSRISCPSNSQLAGWSLILAGTGFMAVILVEVGEHGWDAKALTTYLFMLTSCMFILTGLSYLMPKIFTGIATRFIVVRAILFGQPFPDVNKVNEDLIFLFATKSEVDAEAMRHPEVPFLSAPPPMPDEWSILVRPVLHQASQYMAPTYYLNAHLQVIDWNLCFDLLFEGIVGELRGRHVNWFIARLRNSEEVFRHASAFPDRIEDQPQVDTERLVYRSREYGVVEFEKVATKLHDLQGQERGWVVTLMVRQVECWDKLIQRLSGRIEDSKFWSIYSVSYDRVLTSYSGYEQLLRSVARAVPDDAVRVVDLGAGTGNASQKVIEGNDRRKVWAVEKNMAMLDIFRSKEWVRGAGDRLKIVKSSVEHLEMLAFEEPFDAAVAVNVLYAVDDVPSCLASLNRILKTDATLSLSTTDSNSRLRPLLDDIKAKLNHDASWKEMSPHYDRVEALNMKLEQGGLTTRYSRAQYCAWLEEAGFRVDLYEPGHYMGAVVVVRATKVADVAAPPEDSMSNPSSVRANASSPSGVRSAATALGAPA